MEKFFLVAAILFICALSSKNISIYNEEIIVAACFTGFILLSRKSLGETFKATFDARMEAIQEELQQVLNPNEVPRCEETVQALLCRNLTLKSATLLNAISSRRMSLQDEIVTGFHVSVSERFVPGSTSKASIVELIREGLVVLRKVRV
ncbi:hypothetical protein MKW94_009309 [Papaver nudicaule]|uniref:ATP synthase protein MI25 n=1 Tax=Papaver nudicaule TaxID=74823 RepID=A0AA41S406_PAPNU|nr:hypothetical protein [Papaver nudicaule]